ncbi:hypothetical protein ALP74_200428 [Pseudomonas coronafaciens pv. garcae]|uniref:Uncharacterized protein n=1 Tax=Pseudomonas coronafaciens pv. garcae TaxID=251653 RepID=A0AB37QM74_9PSED|nr:hypothetical protein ALP74_200428 [Pseudomonas coronafaciens pv. garcae]RMS97883.1 hypothetical protein ALP56_200156 [Pseudomonas coronafaciens pv. oryzae]
MIDSTKLKKFTWFLFVFFSFHTGFGAFKH